MMVIIQSPDIAAEVDKKGDDVRLPIFRCVVEGGKPLKITFIRVTTKIKRTLIYWTTINAFLILSNYKVVEFF